MENGQHEKRELSDRPVVEDQPFRISTSSRSTSNISACIEMIASIHRDCPDRAAGLSQSLTGDRGQLL